MAAKKTRRTTKAKAAKQEKTVFAPRRSESRPLIALTLAILGALLAFALWDYNQTQSFFFQNGLLKSLAKTTELAANNGIGRIGSTAAILLFNILGLAAFFIPICIFLAAYNLLFHKAHTLFPWKISLMVVGLVSFATLLDMSDSHDPASSSSLFAVFGIQNYIPQGAGGSLGTFLYRDITLPLLGEVGSGVLLVLVYAFCILGIFVDDPKRTIADKIHSLRERWEQRQEQRRLRAETLREAKRQHAEAIALAKKKLQEAKTKGFVPTPAKEEVPEESPPTDSDFSAGQPTPEDTELEFSQDDASDDDTEREIVDLDDDTGAADFSQENDGPTSTLSKNKPKVTTPAKLTILQEETIERATGTLTPKKKGDYQFPPVTLLKEPPPPENTPAENYEERAERLITTLGEFKIKVELGEIQTGPVITRYEVTPAPGVRVEKIAGLANNLAMSLKAESVRVLAPVPGKGTVGIEVPNRKPKPVSLREIVESKAWQENKCEIPVVLGKDVTGKPIITDLARMPHCLIAGSTGSGKSVCINSVVASLVYHAGPDDIRFIMVDPKVVELQVYNKLPHMLIPVVTEAKKVPGALKWLISEMERRYQIFAKTGVKNIAGFNAKISRDREDAERARQMDLALSAEERFAAAQAVDVPRDDGVLEIPDKKLPYIVCFIDELADLMMVAPADIETAIARLAQLARAAGIHLILATQRPSVNVITGIIKANLPCRIAFKVTSLIDSRTILDQKGAEALIGRGDMLFIPPGSAHLVRAQGAYVSEEEINDLVEHIAEHNGEPEFDDYVQGEIERAAMESEDMAPTEGTDDPSEDPMIAKSWEIIRTTKRASTSMLQRRLSIGYNRAARIMDTLEERGYVGPENGSSPREILKEI
ncbi:MAG: DNA translocase FtsK [Puniceicoccales bacterium]|jgi:S-DNA-T family DNA segregation ATPase FtsK/SpoIIIE|nr:DNA translocase FtsK [Puniceicoccales bacterium]